MKNKGIKIVYIIAAIVFAIYFVHFVSHFQSKRFRKLLRETNAWIMQQNYFV